MTEIVPSHHINHRIPYDLLLRVDDYCKKNRRYSRTETINELLDLALKVKENLHKLKDPEMVTELYTQLQEGGAVDYIQRLGHREFAVLHSIIENEYKDRNGRQTKLI
jgi:hypothetical protein